jgi:hypothetical protein
VADVCQMIRGILSNSSTHAATGTNQQFAEIAKRY